MKDKQTLGYELVKTIILLACTLVSGCMLFYYMRSSYFNVHDDLYEYCLVVNGEAFSSILSAAKEQGRIIFLFTNFLEIVPMLAQNMFIYKCFAYASVILVSVTLWLIVKKHINSDVAWLSVIFYLAFSQLDSQHNSLISYVLWRQIDIWFCMMGINCYVNYLKSDCRLKKQVILSAVFYIISALCYENYLLFGAVYFVMSCVYLINKKNFNVVRAIKGIIPHCIAAAVYLIVYYSWSFMYPSTYEGTQIDSGIDIVGSSLALLSYTFGKFPGYTAGRMLVSRDKLSLSYFASQTSAFDIIQMLLIVAAFIVIVAGLKKSDKKIGGKTMVYTIGLCVGSALLLNVLIAMTAKYKQWVIAGGAYSYVSTNASFMFLCVVLASLSIYLFEIIPEKIRALRGLYVGAVSVLLVVLSLLINVSNDTFADEELVIARRYEAFDSFVRSDMLDEVSESDVVYIPEFEEYNSLDCDFEKYTLGVSGKKVNYRQNKDDIDWNKKVYYYYYDYDNKSLTWDIIN